MRRFSDFSVGAVTCFYASVGEKTFTDGLQTVGMLSDFYAGILVAWQLDGVKFALGPTIATTRSHLAGFGGYAAIENRPADDLLVGRLIAEQGLEVRLLPYVVDTVADFQSMRELVHKRLRWIVVMRHMRPWGHLGLLLTQGLAMVAGGDRRASHGRGCIRLSGHVFCAALRHHLADRRVWNEAARAVEAHAAHRRLGCAGIRHLAGQLPAPQHSLARRGLLYSRRRAGAGG